MANRSPYEVTVQLILAAPYTRRLAADHPGFVGIKNDKDIADLWAYLKQFGADGAKK